jgi:hypothetical protein
MMRLTSRPGQSAALAAAEPLADDVELADVGAGGAEVARQREFVVERDGLDRGRQQRRAAAGNQTQAKVVGPERLDDAKDLGGALHARGRRLVHPRRARPVQSDPRKRPGAILGHVDPAGQAFFLGPARPEDLLDDGGHARAGFARPHHGDPPDRSQRDRFLGDAQRGIFDPKPSAHENVGPNGVDPGLPNGQRVATEWILGTSRHAGACHIGCG